MNKRGVDTQKIREDYGTVKRFCKLHGINYNTYKAWMGGADSSTVEKILRKAGYLRSAR